MHSGRLPSSCFLSLPWPGLAVAMTTAHISHTGEQYHAKAEAKTGNSALCSVVAFRGVFTAGNRNQTHGGDYKCGH